MPAGSGTKSLPQLKLTPWPLGPKAAQLCSWLQKPFRCFLSPPKAFGSNPSTQTSFVGPGSTAGGKGTPHSPLPLPTAEAGFQTKTPCISMGMQTVSCGEGSALGCNSSPDARLQTQVFTSPRRNKKNEFVVASFPP